MWKVQATGIWTGFSSVLQQQVAELRRRERVSWLSCLASLS